MDGVFGDTCPDEAPTTVPTARLDPGTINSYVTVNPSTILGKWLAAIRDPTNCPTILEGGCYLKGSPSYAIDEFIDSLRHNLGPRVLHLQNIAISNTQVRQLLDVLPSTYIYAVNLGEVELDATSRQYFCDTIPKTHLVQIWLKDLRNAKLQRHLLHLLELNRSKVTAIHSRIEEPLPENVQTMWRRIKLAPSLPSGNQKRPDNDTSNFIPPPKKSRSSTSKSFPHDRKTKSQHSKKPLTPLPVISSTQRLLDTYFTPTTISTLHLTQSYHNQEAQQRKHNADTIPASDSQQRPRRNRSKVAKRSHEIHAAAPRAGAEEDTGEEGAAWSAADADAAASAAARSSNSSCLDVTCYCPDNLCHDVSVMPACDVAATIKSPEILSCPLALPGTIYRTGGPRNRRITKHSRTRGASSRGSTSKLEQANIVPVAQNTTPPTDSHSPAIVPLSNSLEYDKGIAFS